MNELEPVGPEDLHWMLAALLSIAAAQIVGCTVPIAAPADALGMGGA